MITFVKHKTIVMNERIREFLSAENKSSVQFAEEIGVQPSGISHILSGRNKPSLDFVLKMLERYNHLSTEWLLFGRGAMYSELVMPGLFDDDSNEKETPVEVDKGNIKESVNLDMEKEYQALITENKVISETNAENNQAVKKIVWFYTDNSFEEYYPGR